MNIFKTDKTPVKYLHFGEHTYVLKLDKIKELCLSPSKDGGGREIQIAQTYEVDENDELNLVSKVEHETKSIGNIQNDMIIYDIFKLLLVSLLENNNTQDNFELTFSNVLVINTLLDWGILEIKK